MQLQITHHHTRTLRAPNIEMETPAFSKSHYFPVLLTTFFFILQLQLLNGARPPPDQPTARHFIITSCKATLYPDLCISSLTPFASTIQTNPTLLARTALRVNLNSARKALKAMISLSSDTNMSPRVASAMQDCMETVGDSIKELKDSLRLIKTMGGKDVAFQLNSVQTWVSAAMTNDDTCMNGFQEEGTDEAFTDAVREKVVKIAQLTSNALAFINRLASSSHSSP